MLINVYYQIVSIVYFIRFSDYSSRVVAVNTYIKIYFLRNRSNEGCACVYFAE